MLDIHLIMKNSKPILVPIIGSLVTGSISVILFGSIGFYFYKENIGVIVILSSLLTIINFIIFYFLFHRYLNNRLNALFRTIKNDRVQNDQSRRSFNMTENVLDQANRATKEFVEKKQEEIVKLQEQDKYRKEFIGNLAHELKTPLFAMQGYILTLLDGGIDDPEINTKFLERAASSTERMINLIEDLDALNKFESNRIGLEKTNFPIKKLIKEVIDSLELKAVEKKITFDISGFSNQEVNADRGRINQVLTNLINNAIVYGNEAGKITIRSFDLNDLILIEIADNGPGIEKEDLPRIFERFYRVEKSRARNLGGSGLGLAIAKQIIDLHKQNINVRSSAGIGTTIGFTLDKAKNEANEITTSRGLKIHKS